MKRLLQIFLIAVVALALIDVSGRLIFPRHPAVSKIIPKAETTITIKEGWTSQDIGKYLASIGPWTSADWFLAVGQPMNDYRANKKLPPLADYSAQFSFLSDKPDYVGLEGYLFPDTYRVFASSTVPEIVTKMLANFDAKLTPQMRADIKKQNKTIYQIVTMASIIEKEAPLNYQTGDNNDAKIISGIFWHRLRIGQALQSDATLSYILGDTATQHSGAALDNKSLYNTYRYGGLPPGPIGNPGILAIEAAIYPTATDYNYFLTTPDGQVVYASTYAQHLQNKYKYLK